MLNTVSDDRVLEIDHFTPYGLLYRCVNDRDNMMVR